MRGRRPRKGSEAEGRGMGGAFARPSGGRGVRSKAEEGEVRVARPKAEEGEGRIARPKAEEGEGRITQAEGLARGEAYCAVAVIKIKARRSVLRSGCIAKWRDDILW